MFLRMSRVGCVFVDVESEMCFCGCRESDVFCGCRESDVFCGCRECGLCLVLVLHVGGGWWRFFFQGVMRVM